MKRAWADAEFRTWLVRDPKAALAAELGVELPESIEVQVVEERPDLLCIVIPVDLSAIPEVTARVMTGRPTIGTAN